MFYFTVAFSSIIAVLEVCWHCKYRNRNKLCLLYVIMHMFIFSTNFLHLHQNVRDEILKTNVTKKKKNRIQLG